MGYASYIQHIYERLNYEFEQINDLADRKLIPKEEWRMHVLLDECRKIKSEVFKILDSVRAQLKILDSAIDPNADIAHELEHQRKLNDKLEKQKNNLKKEFEIEREKRKRVEHKIQQIENLMKETMLSKSSRLG